MRRSAVGLGGDRFRSDHPGKGIAVLLLLTEALVAEIPDEKKNAMPGGDMGGMGGMY